MRGFLYLVMVIALLSGCVSASVTPLATAPEGLSPTSASQVAVYDDTSSVQCEFSRVAIVHVTAEENVSRAELMQKAKSAAAKEGANAVVAISSSTTDARYGLDEDNNMEMKRAPSGRSKVLALFEERPCKQ